MFITLSSSRCLTMFNLRVVREYFLKSQLNAFIFLMERRQSWGSQTRGNDFDCISWTDSFDLFRITSSTSPFDLDSFLVKSFSQQIKEVNKDTGDENIFSSLMSKYFLSSLFSSYTKQDYARLERQHSASSQADRHHVSPKELLEAQIFIRK